MTVTNTGQIITGDEKCVFYHKVTRKKQRLEKGETSNPISKTYNTKKSICCVWWDIKEIIMFKLLSKNQTLTLQLYIEQLQRFLLKYKSNP